MSAMGVFTPRRRRLGPAVLFGLLLSCLPATATGAANMYVSDTTLETILRSGPGNNYRITASIQVGTAVSLLKEEADWAQVGMEDGRSGWIPRQYLSAQQPWRMTAEKLKKDKRELQSRTSRTEAVDRDLREETGALKKQLESERKELSTLRQEHEALKKGAAQYLQLKVAHDQLISELQQYRSQFDAMEKKYTSLSSSTAMEWFLTGAGVLFGGWLLGLFMARSRRRRAAELYR
ncbi:MAG TPA: TIGR04211 family SH3 domain-containing protein [Syntrophobacteria bacterium]|nr:TIGR04211 family SH3 domain-containing protein [Syntrophobacteria bacterium]